LWLDDSLTSSDAIQFPHYKTDPLPSETLLHCVNVSPSTLTHPRWSWMAQSSGI